MPAAEDARASADGGACAAPDLTCSAGSARSAASGRPRPGPASLPPAQGEGSVWSLDPKALGARSVSGPLLPAKEQKDLASVTREAGRLSVSAGVNRLPSRVTGQLSDSRMAGRVSRSDSYGGCVLAALPSLCSFQQLGLRRLRAGPQQSLERWLSRCARRAERASG